MTERDETRERFIAAIAEKIPADSIVEAHLFQPLKQGGMESGVAVVAVSEPKLAENIVTADSPEVDAETQTVAPSATAEPEGERARDSKVGAQLNRDRLAVYTARYRLTQKGPERGKWEFALSAEADAPLVTVDKVVQGVQRRSGDSEDPQRLSGDEFRAALPPAPPSDLPTPP